MASLNLFFASTWRTALRPWPEHRGNSRFYATKPGLLTPCFGLAWSLPP